MKRTIKWMSVMMLVSCVGCSSTGISSSSAEPSQEIEESASASASVEVDGCTHEGLDAKFTDTNSLLLLANKKHALPEGYEPSDLVDAGIPCSNGQATMRAEAASALQEMYQAASQDGVGLAISSAYRSETYQTSLYYGYSSTYGQTVADTISSRPGYSDHQTGLACDFVDGTSADFTEAFAKTESGIWLMQNAYQYGFILHYPNGKDDITGYAYEPWHYRYIGKEEALNLHDAGENETFEEYYGVIGGDYCGE